MGAGQGCGPCMFWSDGPVYGERDRWPEPCMDAAGSEKGIKEYKSAYRATKAMY